MPNQRGSHQKLIPVFVTEDFLHLLEREIRLRGFNNRSEFIRQAIVEKLERLGVKVPAGMGSPPARFGKTHYPDPSSAATASLNDHPALDEAKLQEVESALQKKIRLAQKGKRKPR